MRAAAILGPGSSAKVLEPFERTSAARWILGVPADATACDAIVIFGGDGTIHRHLAQLVKLRLPVLVVPCGSGNDLARALNLGSIQNSLAAWRGFAAGANNTRIIDLGLITPLETRTATYYCCVGGVGLDGEIARRANRLPRWLRARGGYALSLPSALLKFNAQPMRIVACNLKQPGVFTERSNRPTVVAAFANTPAYGGGMKIAPRARLNDGLLDVCIVGEVAKLRLLRLFPSLYFGRHLEVPEVQYFQSDRLQIETAVPLEVYADGEYVCRTPIEVNIAPTALTVVVP
jgi:diacylglycerol kinase (ATP)